MSDLNTLAFRFTPAGLDDHPEVSALIDRLSLGRFVTESLFSPGGRNLNWAGETTTGDLVFVKALPPVPEVTADALRRTLAYEQAAAGLPPESPLRSPQMLGYDEAAGLVAYVLLPAARGLNALAVASELEPDVCSLSGAALGALHRLPVGGVDSVDDRPLEMPPLPWLRAMPVEVLGTYTMAQLAGWRLMQSDQALIAGLHTLREGEERAGRVPIHGDLRMDQFLLSDRLLYMCDWESFRLGDPARDVGAFIGELLFQATYLELTRRDEAPTGGETALDHADVMRRGRAGLDRAIPLVQAFWTAYTPPGPDPDLPARTFGFAGWHMFDRLLTWAEDSTQLNPAAKALAGIGRQLVLNPLGAARLFAAQTDASTAERRNG